MRRGGRSMSESLQVLEGLTGSGAGRRLVSVDDDRDIGKLIGRVAEALGFDSTVTSTAKEFKAAFVSQQPQVVVVDIFMPEMDGIELVQWILKRRVDLHIVVISGNDPVFAETAILLARERGVSRIDFLTKPVDLPELGEVLASGAADRESTAVP